MGSTGTTAGSVVAAATFGHGLEASLAIGGTQTGAANDGMLAQVGGQSSGAERSFLEVFGIGSNQSSSMSIDDQAEPATITGQGDAGQFVSFPASFQQLIQSSANGAVPQMLVQYPQQHMLQQMGRGESHVGLLHGNQYLQLHYASQPSMGHMPAVFPLVVQQGQQMTVQDFVLLQHFLGQPIPGGPAPHGSGRPSSSSGFAVPQVPAHQTFGAGSSQHAPFSPEMIGLYFLDSGMFAD
jgi:hypothetical protein